MRVVLFFRLMRRGRDYNYYFTSFCNIMYIVNIQYYNSIYISRYFVIFCTFLAYFLAYSVILPTFILHKIITYEIQPYNLSSCPIKGWP